MTKKRLQIFIASSSKYLQKDENNEIDVNATNEGKLHPVIEGLENAGLQPIPWWDTMKVFHDGNTHLSNLISASKKFDGGVFILGDDHEGGIPNLNVLLEAGMFYANKGIRRTLVIIDGAYEDINIPSDIFGYQVPKLSDPNLSYRINVFFNTEADEENKLFDNVTYYISDRLSKRIKNENYTAWKTKAQYVGTHGARLWDEIEGDPSYKINVTQLQKFLKRIIDEGKVDFDIVDNIVSIGCGNGSTDNVILKRVIRINRSICYIPVDINPMMVSIASENIDQTARMPFAIIDDFEDNDGHIKKIIDGKINEVGENNFFMMLGVTFSNLEGIEPDFFNKVNSWMDANDYFLIDASLLSDGDEDSLRKAVHEEKYKKLLYNSLIKRKIINESIPISDIDFEVEEINDHRVLQLYTEVPNTKVYSAKYRNEIILISKRYDINELEREISDSFDLVLKEAVESQSGRKKAFFLFKLK